MREFDPSEIEQGGIMEEEDAKTGHCPILKQQCLGELCMWWVKDWSEERRKFQSNCAVSLIAIGINDEALQRTDDS